MSTHEKREWKHNFIAVLAHDAIMECISYLANYRRDYTLLDEFTLGGTLTMTLQWRHPDHPSALLTCMFKPNESGYRFFERVVTPLRLKPKQKPYSFLISDK